MLEQIESGSPQIRRNALVTEAGGSPRSTHHKTAVRRQSERREQFACVGGNVALGQYRGAYAFWQRTGGDLSCTNWNERPAQVRDEILSIGTGSHNDTFSLHHSAFRLDFKSSGKAFKRNCPSSIIDSDSKL